MVLTIEVNSRYHGLTVYFFRKSGQTGKVVPLGTAKIDNNGVGIRTFDTAVGGVIAAYGHLLGAKDISNSYSNTVAFKVK